MLAALLLQAVAGPMLPVTRARPATPCPVEQTEDVVVCARSPDTFRLKPLPPRPDEPAISKAEIGLGNTRLAAEAEQATLANGQQTKRLMVRWKIPLGGKAKR